MMSIDSYKTPKYGDFEGKLGFCAYAPVPPEIHDLIDGFAELHSFRFIVELQGNIEIEIIPDAKYSDFYNARQKVMQITSPDKISPTMLANCIAPVGLKLQQFCMEQIEIKEVMKIGSQVDNPLVSDRYSSLSPTGFYEGTVSNNGKRSCNEAV